MSVKEVIGCLIAGYLISSLIIVYYKRDKPSYEKVYSYERAYSDGYQARIDYERGK